MSNQTRIQPGVPAGGQFATSARAEADVDLADNATFPPSEEAALSADISEFQAAKARIEMRSARLVARRLQQRWPNAAYLQMEVSDQGDDAMWPAAVLDANGREIADSADIEDDDELVDVLSNLNDDDGDWTAYRDYRGTQGRVPHLDLARAAAIPDSSVADTRRPPPAPLNDRRAAARATVENAISAAFAGMSDRDAERFEEIAIDAGLLGRCSECGYNAGLSEKGEPCGECGSDDVQWEGADL